MFDTISLFRLTIRDMRIPAIISLGHGLDLRWISSLGGRSVIYHLHQRQGRPNHDVVENAVECIIDQEDLEAIQYRTMSVTKPIYK